MPRSLLQGGFIFTAGEKSPAALVNSGNQLLSKHLSENSFSLMEFQESKSKLHLF